MTRVRITLELPPTLNKMLAAANQRRGKGSAYSSMKSEWTNRIAASIQEWLNIDGEPWQEAWVRADFYCPLSHDPDNLLASLKFVMDALGTEKGTGLLRNDNLQVVKGIIPTFTKAKRGEEKLVLTLSDRPMFEVKELEDSEVFDAFVEANPVNPSKRKKR